MYKIILFFLFTITFNAYASVPGGVEGFIERLHVYREMERRLMLVCYGNDGNSTGFYEDHVFTNYALSPDEGTLNCNEQLINLAQLQEQIEIEAQEFRVQGANADLSVLGCADLESVMPVGGGVSSEIENIQAEASFNTGCQMSPGDDERNLRCGVFVACSIGSKLTIGGMLAERVMPNNICGDVEGPENNCMDTMIEGMENGIDNFFGVWQSALERATLLVETTNIRWRDWYRQNYTDYGDRVADNVSYFTESEQQMIDWGAEYFNATDEVQDYMLYNLGATIWNSLSEAAKTGYGCEEFQDGVCVRPMENWCTASCGAKINSVCGVVASIGTEAILGMAFGAGFTQGALQGFRVGSEVLGMAQRGIMSAAETAGRTSRDITEAVTRRFRNAFPGIDDRRYARRYGVIRREATRNPALAARLAWTQARELFDGPIGRGILRAGRSLDLEKRSRPGGALGGNGSTWLSTINARQVNGRLVISPTETSEVIMEFNQLAQRAASLADSSSPAMSQALRGVNSDMELARRSVIDNFTATEVRGLADNPNIATTQVRYTIPGTDRQTTRNAIISLETTPAQSTDLISISAPTVPTSSVPSSQLQLVPVRTAARVAPEAPEGNIFLDPVGNRRNADGSLRPMTQAEVETTLNEIYPDNPQFNSRLAGRVQATDLDTLDDANEALRVAQETLREIGGDDLVRQRPDLFGPLDEVPIQTRQEWLDSVSIVVRNRNPGSDVSGADDLFDALDTRSRSITSGGTNNGIGGANDDIALIINNPTSARAAATPQSQSRVPVSQRSVNQANTARTPSTTPDSVSPSGVNLAGNNFVTNADVGGMPTYTPIPRVTRFRDIPGIEDSGLRLLRDPAGNPIESLSVGRDVPIPRQRIIDDITNKMDNWPDAHRREVLDFIGEIDDQNIKQQYFALLLGDEATNIIGTDGRIIRPNVLLDRLRRANDPENPSGRSDVIAEINQDIATQSNILDNNPAGSDAAEGASDLRARLELQRELLLHGDQFEVEGMFSASTYNVVNGIDNQAHSTNGTFSLALRVRDGESISLIRGGGSDGNSGIIGSYYRFKSDGEEYFDQNTFSHRVAAPEEAYRVYARFDVESGTSFNLGNNADVNWSNGPYTKGGGYEITGFRAQIHQLRAAVRSPFCSTSGNSFCQGLFDLQRDINFGALEANPAGAADLLRRAEIDLDARISSQFTPEQLTEINRIMGQSDVSIDEIMIQAGRTNPDLISALILRQEIRAKRQMDFTRRPLARDPNTQFMYDQHVAASRAPNGQSTSEYVQGLVDSGKTPDQIRAQIQQDYRNHPVLTRFRANQARKAELRNSYRAADSPQERINILQEMSDIEVDQESLRLAAGNIAGGLKYDIQIDGPTPTTPITVTSAKTSGALSAEALNQSFADVGSITSDIIGN